jgi:hypothetical protein
MLAVLESRYGMASHALAHTEQYVWTCTCRYVLLNMHYPAPLFVCGLIAMSSPCLVHVHEKWRGHVEMRGACVALVW